jgi:P-type Cu2+ transporter
MSMDPQHSLYKEQDCVQVDAVSHHQHGSNSQADLGIAIVAVTNVAIESADLVLVRSDLADVAYALNLATAAYNKMIQNLFWASGYNIVGIPLAAGVAYPLGVVISPALAALFMTISTVIVSINAMLLRRMKN